MAYSEIDQTTLDLNWYFRDFYNRVCVCASGGGLLPKPIVENDSGNEEFHNYALELPQKFEVERIKDVRGKIEGISSENIDLYFQNFESLASRGLYVFDKLQLNNPEDGYYVLVAYPIYNTKIDPYPFDKSKLKLISRTSSSIISRLNQQLNSSSFQPKDLTSFLNNFAV